MGSIKKIKHLKNKLFRSINIVLYNTFDTGQGLVKYYSNSFMKMLKLFERLCVISLELDSNYDIQSSDYLNKDYSNGNFLFIAI